MSKKFITKDSGARQEYASGMRRDLQIDKPNLYLWIPQDQPYEDQFLTRLGHLAQRGAVKYGERNSFKADSQEEYERFRASAFRHLLQWLSNDEEEDHAAAIFFNVLMAEYVKWKIKKSKE